MATERKLAGVREAIEIRRIGYRHAVVTPSRQTQLVDVNRVRVDLAQAEEQVARAEAQAAAARVRRDELSAFVAAFEAQTADRVDGDPVVPLEAPLPDPPVKRESEPAAPTGRGR